MTLVELGYSQAVQGRTRYPEDGVTVVWWGLRELAFSGLTVDQLHGVLSAWKVLPRGTKTWEEVMAAGNSGGPYPMGPFAYLVQSVRRYSCTQLISCVFPSLNQNPMWFLLHPTLPLHSH